MKKKRKIRKLILLKVRILRFVLIEKEEKTVFKIPSRKGKTDEKMFLKIVFGVFIRLVIRAF